MKFADYFKEPEIGNGNVSVWRHHDGSYFVIEITRFASDDKETARQYACMLAGDPNYQISDQLQYTLH
ncbi:MAG: hypothetical protein CME70_17760 [Halobacteriovorax sp.]|nr:hypothetical protein [Halobacteriovorax sp.]|tara:strand:+ start:19827 stop:20030 length:204 start_codon:yes stop_codon:yes gene_type:complete